MIRSLILILAITFSLSSARSQGVSRSECFPVERLPKELRPQAEELLLKLLDSEALYTLVGNLKPLSSGWASLRIDVDNPNLAEAEQLRQVLRTFRCGDELSANLQPFWRVFEGRRYLDAYLFNHRLVAEKIRQHQRFFGFYGVSPSSNPVEVLMAFEVDQTPQRNRGYGYLFGYPKYAVDFFVESEQVSRATKQFVERDFFAVPVFAGETGRFVWAVPKGHVPTSEDIGIKQQAAPILSYYKKLRTKYIGPNKAGVVQLLRDWFDNGKGQCSAQTAHQKAMGASQK